MECGYVSRADVALTKQLMAAEGGSWVHGLLRASPRDEEELCDALAWALGVPRAAPDALARVTPQLAALIPLELSQRFMAVPLRRERGAVLAGGLCDPTNEAACHAIAAHTGLAVRATFAAPMEVRWVQERCYPGCLAVTLDHGTPERGAALERGWRSGVRR